MYGTEDIDLIRLEGLDLKKVAVCVCLTALLFGTMEVALKIGGENLDSIQLTFLRFLIGALMLVPFAVHERKGKGMPEVKDLGWIFVTGVVGIAVSMVCFQMGVERCNAATAASLICMNPLFTMVIAHLFTSEKMNRRKAVALAIGLTAMVLMIRPWDIQEGNTAYGMALMVTASVTFAIYTVMGKKSISRVGTFTQTSIGFFCGCLVLLVEMLIKGRPVFGGVAENIWIVLYVGIFVTGLGYAFYFLAIRYSDASTGSIAFFIKPAIAPVLAVLILNEEIYWNTVLGIVMLITASFITLNRKKKVTEVTDQV